MSTEGYLGEDSYKVVVLLEQWVGFIVAVLLTEIGRTGCRVSLPPKLRTHFHINTLIHRT